MSYCCCHTGHYIFPHYLEMILSPSLVNNVKQATEAIEKTSKTVRVNVAALLDCDWLMEAVNHRQTGPENRSGSSVQVLKMLKSDYIRLFYSLFCYCLFVCLLVCTKAFSVACFSSCHGFLFPFRVNVAHQPHFCKKYFVLPQLAQLTKHQI